MSKKSKQILVVSLLIIVAMILIDQVSKFLVSSNMKMFENISVIKGFFSIYRCTNTGSAFSFLGGYSWSIIFLSIFSSIASIVVLYFVLLLIYLFNCIGLLVTSWQRFFLQPISTQQVPCVLFRQW